MALYFFHLHDGDELVPDPDGRELDGESDIPAIALHEARGILSQDALAGRISLDQHLDVEDSNGKLVHRLSFEDAIQIVRARA